MSENESNKITVFIDGDSYEHRSGIVDVSALRALRKPPVPEGKELWLDIEDAMDQRLDDRGQIDLLDGMRFFTEIDAITIRIDRTDYQVYKRKMTGLELREVPTPAVSPDRDLWREVPDKRDVKVQDDDIVRVRDGSRFFTAPGRINPGAPDDPS